MLWTTIVFSQDEMPQRGSIPEELLRPRRDEAPRYPVDTVIGELGRGEAPQEAYEVARNAAIAFLAGNKDARVLSPANKVFVENCMDLLQAVNPRSYRLGGGREEPDGSFSFLVRFIGREEGITGELYVRYEEQRSEVRQERSSEPRPEPVPEPPPPEAADAVETAAAAEPDGAETEAEPDGEGEDQVAEQEQEPAPAPAPAPTPPRNTPAQRIWLFEDLILEEPRSREVENSDSRHRFDFPPYERFF